MPLRCPTTSMWMCAQKSRAQRGLQRARPHSCPQHGGQGVGACPRAESELEGPGSVIKARGILACQGAGHKPLQRVTVGNALHPLISAAP